MDLSALLDAWSLTPGERYAYSYASVALKVTRADGTPAVLKVQHPHRESEHEADALRAWDGAGAVRLLAHDPDRHALLLERCEPGTPLGAGDSPVDVLVALLPRLWLPAGPAFRPLAEEAAWWAAALRRRLRHYDPRVLGEALGLLCDLPASASGEPVLLNQDLHCGNVLRAEREPWLVIDPKPLAGEREFALAPVLRDPLVAGVDAAFDRLTAELDLDRERARGWALAQTVAWSYEDGRLLPGHLRVAEWLRGLRT